MNPIFNLPNEPQLAVLMVYLAETQSMLKTLDSLVSQHFKSPEQRSLKIAIGNLAVLKRQLDIIC